MFLCLAFNANCLPSFACANVDGSCFYIEDPEGEDAVEDCVDGYCGCGIVFGGVESELVVPVKGCSADCECGVAEG